MIYIIGTMVVLALVLFGVWLTGKAVDSYEWFSKETIAAFLFWSVCLGFLFGAIIENEKSGPCVQYETQIHYNAATKTMMPARVCVNRGEWEKSQ